MRLRLLGIASTAAFLLVVGRARAAGSETSTVVSHPFAAAGDLARLGPTVGELVASQWGGHGGRRLIRSDVVCPDAACGAQDARARGASDALVGRIDALGGKLTVTALWVAADGTVRSSAMATAANESELPQAVQKLAADLDASATPAGAAPASPSAPPAPPPVSPAAAPPPLVPAAAPPPPLVPAAAQEPRYAGESAPEVPIEGSSRHRTGHTLLRIGGFVPLNGYTPNTTSLSGELGALLDLGPVLLEPRISLRRSLDDSGSWYLQVPADFGLVFRIGDEKVFPLFGGGLGVHFLAMHREVRQTVGTIVYTHHTDSVTESALGLGGFARAGVGFELPRSVLLLLTVDYDLTVAKLGDRDLHQAGVLSVGFGL